MIEIRKSRIWDVWVWSCPVCHYGMNVPWEQAPDWHTAITETLAHLQDHRITGVCLEPQWIPLTMVSR